MSKRILGHPNVMLTAQNKGYRNSYIYAQLTMKRLDFKGEIQNSWSKIIEVIPKE